MAFLEKFSPEDRDMIVSIPYKAGVWVSAADNDGREAAEKELSALEGIINRQARGMFESAFVHEVMAEAYARRKEWPAWAAQAHAVPEECSKAAGAMSKVLGAREIESYRRSVMAVAIEVARTFREFDVREPLLTRIGAGFRRFMDRLAGLAQRGGYDLTDWRSISYEEDAALAALSRALGAEDGAG